MRQELIQVEVGGGLAFAEVEEKPDCVWRWQLQEPPKQDVTPVHLVNAQLEDEVHDWRWNDGGLVFKGRGIKHGQSYWLILQYKDGEEPGQVECSSCGTTLPGTANFCMTCGTEL